MDNKGQEAKTSCQLIPTTEIWLFKKNLFTVVIRVCPYQMKCLYFMTDYLFQTMLANHIG